LTTPGKGRIFISYRRADSAGYAGRIYDRLAAHFGEDAVFMDVDTIEAGLDFVDVLQNAVQSCDVLIALVGRRWLGSKDAGGKRRLDNPEDFVRIEIAAALERDIRVIPVLVDGVSMPYSTELPDNLKSLARRNALQVDHHSFNADAQRLITQLELALKAVERAKAEKVRREQEALEKKVAEERRKQETAAKAAREKVEREQKEREAREKQAAEERRIKEAAEKAALEAAQHEALEKSRKERIAREKREAGEKTRKAELRKVRLQETTEHIKNLFRSRGKYTFFVGIVILFLLGYFFRNAVAPSMPSQSTEILPALVPTPGVGSTMISEKDGMVMVYVPSGKFQMGNTAEDAFEDCQKVFNNCQLDWFRSEEPPQIIYLDAFWIDQTEVTNEMFAAFLNAKGNQGEGNVNWLDMSHGDERIHKKGETWWADSLYGDHPVIEVSWYGAKAYCEWAGHRLPTEAEWEKAARGGLEGEAYPWGDEAPVCEKGAKNGAQTSRCVGQTVTVGSFGQNGYGLYDMAGNAFEWVSSLNYPYPYSVSDGREDLSVNDSRVIRGGAWYDNEVNFVRSAYRWGGIPTGGSGTIGFRCARDKE
jgi:formylglycine-generating enzyme required for sulfatase activity